MNSLKGIKSKILCAFLVASLALSCLACKSNETNSPGIAASPNAPELNTSAAANAYALTELSVPSSVISANSIAYDGGMVYIYGSEYTEEAMLNHLFAINLESGEAIEIPLDGIEGDIAAVTVKNGEIYLLVQSSGAIMTRGSGGTFSSSMMTGDDMQDASARLIKLDAAGGELLNIDIAPHIGQSSSGSGMSSRFSISGGGLIVDPNGNIAVLSDGAILVFSPAGDFLFKAGGDDNSMIMAIIETSGGEILAQIADTSIGGYVLRPLDMNAKALSDEKFQAPGTGYNSSLFSGAGDEADIIFYNDGNAVYSYNYKTGELKETLNWVDSDINAEGLRAVAAAENGQFVYFGFNMYDYSTELCLLSRLDPEEAANKTVATIAITQSNVELRAAIIDFNKSNPDYRLKLLDYSAYSTTDNPSGAAEQLNNDIIAGNIPDIVVISDNLPMSSYIQKGLFKDIYELMDADGDLNRGDYLANILGALETGGKLYSIMPSFSIETVMGKKSVVGDRSGWTLADLEALLATLPEGSAPFYDMTRDAILEALLNISMDNFVNFETAKCTFDSDAFIKLLEYAKTYPQSVDDDSSSNQMGMSVSVAMVGGGGRPTSFMSDFSLEEALNSGKALLVNYTLNDIRGVQRMKFMFGESLSFVGYPVESANGSVIASQMELAISASGTNTDGAWAFVKYLLSDDYQNNMRADLPLKASALDELARLAVLPNSYVTDEGEEVTIPDYYFSGGQLVEIDLLTQQDVDDIVSFIKSVNRAAANNSSIMGIIAEEIGPFFAGQKTAESTASVIQSRVQTYLSEQQ